MSKLWWGNDYKQLYKDTEARLAAALDENARLRNEVDQLRRTARPPMMMIGMGKDDDAGEFGYSQSDVGW